MFQRLRHSIKIDHIIAKAVDVFGSIRTECAQRVHIGEAQAFIKALTAELQAEGPERFGQKPQRQKVLIMRTVRDERKQMGPKMGQVLLVGAMWSVRSPLTTAILSREP